MNSKRAIALFAAIMMAMMPLMCVADTSQADDGQDSWSTGTHLVLHDLDNNDMAYLGWPDWNYSSNGILPPFFYNIGFYFGLLLPGINYEAFIGPENDKIFPEFKNFDVKLDYSESVSGCEVKYIIGMEVNAPEMTLKVTPIKDEPILLQPPEDTKLMNILYNMLSCGDYSRALLKDFYGKTWDGSQIVINGSAKLKLYYESSFTLVKIDDKGNYAYSSGGYQMPTTFFAAAEDNSAPISKLYVDGELSAESTIAGKHVEFDTDINLCSEMDIERYYPGQVSELEIGSLYVDNVKNAKLVLNECSKYNGNENGKFLDFDFTNQFNAGIDGRLLKLKSDSFFVYGEGFFAENELLWSDIVPAVLKESDRPYDPALEQKAQDMMKEVDSDAEFSRDYDKTVSSAESIKDSITGSHSDNTMLIVGIAIAVIVILAIVALWYFKFRTGI